MFLQVGFRGCFHIHRLEEGNTIKGNSEVCKYVFLNNANDVTISSSAIRCEKLHHFPLVTTIKSMCCDLSEDSVSIQGVIL